MNQNRLTITKTTRTSLTLHPYIAVSPTLHPYIALSPTLHPYIAVSNLSTLSTITSYPENFVTISLMVQ